MTEPIDAKYRGPMKFAMTGDVDLAARYKPRAQEMLARLVNEWRPDQQIIDGRPAPEFASQGYRVDNESYEEAGMRINIRCIVNETQRLAYIHAYRPPKPDHKPEPTDEQTPQPYLWIGIRPLTGGWSGCYTPPDWYENNFNEHGGNWVSSYDGIAGYLAGVLEDFGDTAIPRPWLFEPTKPGAAITPIIDYGVEINGRGEAGAPNETWLVYREEGGSAAPFDAIVEQRGKVHFSNSLDPDISGEVERWFPLDSVNSYMVTKNGTFAAWGAFNRELDPEESKNEWWAAFWVDPNPAIEPRIKGINYDAIPLERHYLAGDYLLKLSSRHNWGNAPGIIPQVVEVEIRTFKAPHTQRSRYLFEMTQGANMAACLYPNGFDEPVAGDAQYGPNPHLEDWLTDALIVSPYRAPKLVTGNIPSWGFVPGNNETDIRSQATNSIDSKTIGVFQSTSSEPYRSNIAALLATFSNRDACGNPEPYTQAEILAKMPNDGVAMYAPAGGGMFQSAAINTFMTDWMLGAVTESQMNDGSYPLFSFADSLGVTQIFVIARTYTDNSGYSIIVKTENNNRWHMSSS